MVTVAETRESLHQIKTTFWIKVATSRGLRQVLNPSTKQSKVDSFASSSLLSSDLNHSNSIVNVSKLPSASVKSLSRIVGMVGKEALPTIRKGGKSPFTAAPLQLPFAPYWKGPRTKLTKWNCVDRRRKRRKPLVLIGTIEERKRMVSPFAFKKGSFILFYKLWRMSGTGWEPSVAYTLSVLVLPGIDQL